MDGTSRASLRSLFTKRGPTKVEEALCYEDGHSGHTCKRGVFNRDIVGFLPLAAVHGLVLHDVALHALTAVVLRFLPVQGHAVLVHIGHIKGGWRVRWGWKMKTESLQQEQRDETADHGDVPNQALLQFLSAAV